MLISSFHPAPTTGFEGYCYINADYVAGPQGAEKYEKAKQTTIEPGHDGCYAVSHQRSYGWELGTDSHGMARLYIYKKGAVWAVASSLYVLVNHLRAHGINPNPNLASLRALSIPTSLTQQPVSRQTIFDDIVLVPSTCRVLINGEGPRVVGSEIGMSVPYEEALAEYLNMWRSRILTLAQDDRTTFSADLSGGLDSRVVFAFLDSVKTQELGERRMRVVSAPNKEDDFRAASGVAGAYGLSLNGPPLPPHSAVSHANALSSWKETSLGTYMPRYLIARDFDPFFIQVHGAGGENYRPYYAPGRGPGDLERFRKYFTGQEFADWHDDVHAELDIIGRGNSPVARDILHYREFRNRMHFGHRPHRRAMFTPLNSNLLDRVHDHTGPRGDRQLYFDIMESLSPGLKDLPYDREAKGPSDANLENLTIVDASAHISAGSVYADYDGEPVCELFDQPVLSRWLDEAEDALDDSDVRSFIGSEAVQASLGGLKDSRESFKSLSANHRATMDLSFALTAKFAFGD